MIGKQVQETPETEVMILKDTSSVTLPFLV